MCYGNGRTEDGKMSHKERPAYLKALKVERNHRYGIREIREHSKLESCNAECVAEERCYLCGTRKEAGMNLSCK